jgi:hypothetical protein
VCRFFGTAWKGCATKKKVGRKSTGETPVPPVLFPNAKRGGFKTRPYDFLAKKTMLL